ncbi:uncharacterized protein LOC127850132 isoform X4 [Dreissena polymorpha]|nr:uncharacterized protein LOC127850132 isoform X4 [Dreissena polymorpha]
MKNTQVNDDAKLFSAGVILTPSNGPRESDAVGTPRSYEMVPTGDTGLVLYPKTCMQCVVDMAAFRLLSIEELRFNDYRLLQLTSRFNPGTRKKIFTYPKGSEEEVVLGETLIFSTQLVCITAISEYMDFSLEELRYIDSFEQHHVLKLKQSIKEDIERTPMSTDASNWPRPTKGFYFSSPESQDFKGRFPEQRECLEHIEKGSDCVHVEKGSDFFFPESFSEKNILTDESVNAIQNVVFAEVIGKGSDYVADYSSDSSESL